ncbi:MAG: lysine--tRNA ligase [Chlamydiota bacterium]
MSNTPEYHSHEEFSNRSRKLAEIRELGVEPYPHQFYPSHSSQELLQKYQDQPVGNSEDAAQEATERVIISGRMILFRAMGKNAFAHIQDSSGTIQVMFNRDISKVTDYIPEESSISQPPGHLKFIEKKFDLGDFIGIEGRVFRTNKGELTVYAKKVTLLCKTLLPLPDKHAGLTDREIRYRKRWLDLISNADSKETLLLRSKIIKSIRNYFENIEFTEVETPVLQNIYGGAAARPFETHFNVLDQKMFLRISLEIPLKKLIVGGLNRIFEISKVFRNEGIDKTHNPEFTELEAYAAYWDYNDMMELFESLVEKLSLDIFGSTSIPYHINEEGEVQYIDVKAPWQRLSMKESIKKYANIDIDALSDEALRDTLLQVAPNLDSKEVRKMSRGLLKFSLFEEAVEDQLIDPVHIIDHPIETTPLCKPHRDPHKRAEGLVERFESFILGKELCNAYTELNDPELQRALLVQQNEKRQSGDEEANPLDEDFIESICQGLPPTAGIGFGIDRLVMLLTNIKSIRDVIFFPFMKSEEL